MDQRTYDAAQQGLLASLVGTDREASVKQFLQELRDEAEWSESQVREVERQIYSLLGMLRSDSARQ